MTLRVGNDSYAAQEIGENQFGFKPLSDGSYAYKVTYIPGNLEDPPSSSPWIPMDIRGRSRSFPSRQYPIR